MRFINRSIYYCRLILLLIFINCCLSNRSFRRRKLWFIS
nr:MAG TPA: hypothetical protein [Caudoviricetes sp.]